MPEETWIGGERFRFETTAWSLVLSARDPQALEKLLTRYWKPLYFFARRKGMVREEAKDVVQGFIETLLERDALLKADPARGRFRTFLLAALSNFIKDRARSAGREKRGGGRALLDFEDEFAQQGYTTETPEAAFNRTWARDLLRQCLVELQGEPSHLEALKLFLSGAPTAEITRATGLSEDAAKQAMHRLRERLRDRLIAHLRETVAGPAELEAEIAEFLSLVR